MRSVAIFAGALFIKHWKILIFGLVLYGGYRYLHQNDVPQRAQTTPTSVPQRAQKAPTKSPERVARKLEAKPVSIDEANGR